MRTRGISGGLTGNILRVDLNCRKVWTEQTMEYASRFPGGRMLATYIMLKEMAPGTKWSDPENILIFSPGILVGTVVPGACRTSVDSKNVFNNGKGSANFGGNFGPELKYAGFDNLVITGKAQTPVYLWIDDRNAELRSAKSIWGKTTYESEEFLKKELGDDRIVVVSIGPAGENLVRGACIVGDCAKVAGGSGVGCVMGNKNLKAIAVRGTGSVRVAQPTRFLDAVNTALKKIENSPFTASWRKGIIESVYQPENKIWDLSVIVRNGQDEYWPVEKRRRLVGRDGVPSYVKKFGACFSCPIGDMPFLEIKEGKYKGTTGKGYWINSAWYSQRFDVDNPAASIKFQLLANQLGLDGDMASVVLSWAFECYEKGLLTQTQTGGLELEWGNDDAMIKMLEKLAYREGIGDLLAEGVKEASQKIGRGSEEFAVHMKGQDSADPYRIRKGWGLGVSTSPVAGRHLRGAVSTPEVSGPKKIAFSPTEYENQPEAVFWQAQMKEMEDLLGVCVYVGSFLGAHALELSDYAELVRSVLGIDLTEEEFMLLARRSYNLEKAFNTIHTNFERKDDLPPRRYMEEHVKSGPYAGHRCDKERWEKMLDRFYELHDWDKGRGLQTHRCLVELGLEDIADMLKKANRLAGE